MRFSKLTSSTLAIIMLALLIFPIGDDVGCNCSMGVHGNKTSENVRVSDCGGDSWNLENLF